MAKATFANELQGITVLHALYKGLIDYDPKTGDPVNVIADSISSPDSFWMGNAVPYRHARGTFRAAWNWRSSAETPSG